jgi:hypothetical protein
LRSFKSTSPALYWSEVVVHRSEIRCSSSKRQRVSWMVTNFVQVVR